VRAAPTRLLEPHIIVTGLAALPKLEMYLVFLFLLQVEGCKAFFFVLVLAVAPSRLRRNDDVGKTSGAELWAVDLFDSHPSFHRPEKSL
jgi:hypothetical protein